MENEEGQQEREGKCNRHYWKRYSHSPAGKILGGFIIIAIGAVLLAKQLGTEFPSWMFTWPMLLITMGLYVGARHLFRNPGWIILVTIGTIFILDDVFPAVSVATYLWPVFIILVGIMTIFKSRKKNCEHHHRRWNRHIRRHRRMHNTNWEQRQEKDEANKEDYLESISVFGSIKKNILSKTFKGGEITCVMGGAEINLSQADIEGRVILEVTQVLGGTKLIIPAHWDVQPEIVAVLGGIEDKRQLNSNVSADKVLVIRGTSILGGIEIKSF